MEKQLTIIVKRCNEKGLISFKVSDQKIEKMIKTMLKNRCIEYIKTNRFSIVDYDPNESVIKFKDSSSMKLYDNSLEYVKPEKDSELVLKIVYELSEETFSIHFETFNMTKAGGFLKGLGELYEKIIADKLTLGDEIKMTEDVGRILEIVLRAYSCKNDIKDNSQTMSFSDINRNPWRWDGSQF